MSDKTKIEWTDATWNPVTGCTKVSPGCDHCYAERVTERFHGPGSFADVQLHPDRLDQPLRWRRPRKVFVNSMSDLFHDDVDDAFIACVFAVMAIAEQHTFQVLTKRHGRMRSLVGKDDFKSRVWAAIEDLPVEISGYTRDIVDMEWPLPNVWLGVSVENQQWADIRIPHLTHTPAAVRFLSCEPLLGPIDVGLHLAFVDWVIVGGESGPGARPMHPDWARTLRDQCHAVGVPFLFKQWGEWAPGQRNALMSKTRWQHESVRFAPDGMQYRADEPDLYSYTGMESLLRVGKKTAGRELDGQTWDEYPDTQVVPA